MRRKLFLIVLTASLLLSSIISIYVIHNLQGNARVINYTGVVRGATQRLIKQELSNKPNDKLVKKIDDIIDELQTGHGELGLIRLASDDFQENMTQMKFDWEGLKKEIYLVREGRDNGNLYFYSEAFFELADDTVHSAELYSEKSVYSAEGTLIILNLALAILVFFIYKYNTKQEKIRKKLEKEEENNKQRKVQLARLAENMRAPLNDISELLYIVDLETYDLLFINETGMKIFEVDSIYGKKCYKVLQGRDAPCDFVLTVI